MLSLFNRCAGRVRGAAPASRLMLMLLALLALGLPVMAQEGGAGEANLKLPDLHQATFLGGIDGHTLLLAGLVVSALGLVFGLVIYQQLKNLPVHGSMRDISEL